VAAWTLVAALDEPDRAAVDALLDAAERAGRDEALTEDARERLATGAGVRHALRRDRGGAVDGYAVVADGEPLAAEPALGSYDTGLAELLEGLARPATLLLRPADDAITSALEARGWRKTRGLGRMRRALPAPPPPPTDLVIRPFEPGHDEARWVAQNNAAFAGHPTQSKMTVAKLEARERQPWFDPKGFLLLVDGDALLASCWTKVHPFEDGDVGEIYVISVAPTAQGRGLGRVAVLAGLAHLAGLGIRVAELFVEDTNVGAVRLYEALGFETVSRVVELRTDPT
jgi:mycothiol synthase